MPGVQPLLEAFWALHYGRHYQWVPDGEVVKPVPDPISTESILLWCSQPGFTDEDGDLFRWCIREADNRFLEWSFDDNNKDYALANEPMSESRFDQIFG